MLSNRINMSTSSCFLSQSFPFAGISPSFPLFRVYLVCNTKFTRLQDTLTALNRPSRTVRGKAGRTCERNCFPIEVAIRRYPPLHVTNSSPTSWPSPQYWLCRFYPLVSFLPLVLFWLPVLPTLTTRLSASLPKSSPLYMPLSV